MSFQEEDVPEITEVMGDVGPIVESSFPVDASQHILGTTATVQQLKRQMCWHPLVVRF